MKAIAAAAGVGLATVSRALADVPIDVSPATVERVREAARDLHYRPSALGRRLKMQRTDTIGLVVADISNPFYGEFAQAVLGSARAADRHVVVGSSGEDPTIEREYIDLLIEQRVDAVIAFPTGANRLSWEAALDLGVRVVFADRTISGMDVPAVVVDNERGMHALTRHLLELGHRRIGYLGGPIEISSGAQREAGFLAAMAGAGVLDATRLVQRGGFTRDAARSGVTRLLDELRPTALIASNNVLGEAALDAVHAARLRYPDDISFVMFDDVAWAALTQPGVTVQAQPTSSLGARAVEMALAVDDPSDVVSLPTSLIPRGSAAPVPTYL